MNAIPFRERCLRVIIAVACLPLTIVQTVISAYNTIKYKHAGELVQIDSGYLHAHVTGSSKPTKTRPSLRWSSFIISSNFYEC
ncbi:hypothetical protein L3i20_v225180 [Paenibacillus sp. L3-i20]|nr:hypothetical protein L3i20_v225180 [Paenibacillus sp. L3-i20]